MLCRLGTAELLRRNGHQVAEYGDPAQLTAIARTRSVDTLVIDVDHTRTDCERYVGGLTASIEHQHVVVLARPHRIAALAQVSAHVIGVETPHTDPAVLLAAVRGRRPRPSTELGRNMQRWSKITSRQRDVLRWLAIGCDNRHIAARLKIGERGVKAHVTALLGLFEVENRTEMALIAYKAGLRPSRRAL